jgi:hypothetical protein
MASKPTANATTRALDLELGRDDIQSSSSATPDEQRSKAATPRRSLEIQDVDYHHQSRASRIAAKLPPPLVRWNKKVVDWVKGPNPPRIYRITPLFERIQTWPVHTLSRFLPRWARVGVYAAACVLWAVVFGVTLSDYSLPKDLGGFGSPVGVSCTTNLWYVLLLVNDDRKVEGKC